jgi:hypothetical protein
MSCWTFCIADSVHKVQQLPLQSCVVVDYKMSMTLSLFVEPGPHDSARGDTTLQRVRGVHAANKYTIVDCGLFDSTIRTDLAQLVFEYTDWAFVHAWSAAQAEPVQYLHT